MRDFLPNGNFLLTGVLPFGNLSSETGETDMTETKPTEKPKGIMEQSDCFDAVSERRAKRRPGWAMAQAAREPATGKRF